MGHTTIAGSPNLRSMGRAVAAIVLGVAFITICAKIRVPSWPVPMTLHTLAVMTIAVVAGPRLSATTFFAYLAVGAAGVPVFSGTPERGIGLAYMLGPTGGYLLGYLAASWLTSMLTTGRQSVGRVLAMLAGLAVTYIVGLAWLVLYVPVRDVITLGFTPFILGDLINIAMVAAAAAAMPSHVFKRSART